MNAALCFAVALAGPWAGTAAEPQPAVSGDAVLKAKAGKSEAVLTTTSRLAGAIHSFVWDGKEFIDSADHGRQMQSAASFDCAEPGEFWAECYNPTEAGSRHDGAGPASTSRLLALEVAGGVLTTRTQMAFWLRPGEKSSGRPAKNREVLSPFVLRKKVQLGYGELDQVLHYTVDFEVPEGERHRLAQFEALTGYMPAEFSAFWAYDARADRLIELTKVAGEQPLPVILATADGRHAMGVYTPDRPRPGDPPVGYGRFEFPVERVTKWNCVFRVRDREQVPSGHYIYRLLVPFGTLADVTATMRTLHKAKP